MLSLPGPRVPSLVKELRSLKIRGTAKKKKKRLLLQEASLDFLRHTGEMPLVTVITKSFEGVGKQVGLAGQSGER